MPVARSPDSQDRFARLCDSFADHGLCVLGALSIRQADCPADFQVHIGAPALLIGNQGGGMWEHFSHSQEYLSGEDNPLDTWTLRKLNELTAGEGCLVFHPSHKPYWPFQQIAEKVTGVAPSPLGILIHPKYGLWHGLRGLLVFDPVHEFESQIKALADKAPDLDHPCETCADRPCLSACPVTAFRNDTLDVQTCFAHLDRGSDPDCMTLGCRARDACPVGTEYRNGNDQIGFHMKAYRGRVGGSG